MSCGDKNQSAIAEARDQLFLDTADGSRLNTVTGNLGLDRPGLGFDDDEWRAVAKLIQLQPKMIRSQFIKVLDVCLGPQYARIGTLAASTALFDRSLNTLDASVYTQTGTLIIDPTLPTEETVGYCIRDVVTGKFELRSPLNTTHVPIPPGAGRLRADALAGATSLLLTDSATLPTTMLPYPVMLDRGTVFEEIVQVIANNTGTNTLTLAAATLYDHFGPVTQYLNTRLLFPLVKAGVGDTIGGAAPNMTLTDAAALFALTDVGNFVTISGATTPANNGTFPITAFGGPTNVTYTNAAGVPEAFTGGWQITRVMPAGRTFAPLEVNATRKFPPTGFVRINHNGPNDEVIEYEATDLVNSILFFKGVTKNPHHATESVELVQGGAQVEVAQVVQTGIHWQLKETEPRKVQIVLPKDFLTLRLIDATWLHAIVPPAAATTLSGNSNIGDLWLLLTSTVGFTDEAAMVTIGPDTYFYTLKLSATDVAATVKTGTLIGALQLSYTLAQTAVANFPNPVGPYRVVIDPGGGNQEFAFVNVTDLDNDALTFTAPLTIAHAPGEVVSLVNQVLLDKPVVNAHVAGAAVNLLTVPYLGLSLEDGNYRDISGAIRYDHFPGGYIFDVQQRGVSSISTFLSKTLPPSANVAVDQVAGYTNLEVADASLWPAPPFSPYPIRVGVGSGFQEDRTLIDRTLKKDNSGTVAVPTLIGATAIDYTLTSAIDFPESNGLSPAGYRVIINAGGINEETAVVLSNNIGTTVFTFVNPLTKPHVYGEQISLLNDVLTMDALQNPHMGPILIPNTFGEEISPFVTEIEVSPAPANFPTTNGFIWLNFGKEKTNGRSRVTSIGSPTSYVLLSTAAFPTSGYPYQVTLGDGAFSEEKVYVTNNNTGTNTLTFAAPGALNAHNTQQYVKFIAGVPEVLEYNFKETLPDRFVFNNPIFVDSRHLVGERVIYSPAISQSNSDGSSFGFKLPPDPAACAKVLVEFLRAAGVQVTITSA
jgi:hypothetical protein